MSNEGEGAMGGGLGGTEMDELLVLRFPSPSLMVCVFFLSFFLAHFSLSFYSLVRYGCSFIPF